MRIRLHAKETIHPPTHSIGGPVAAVEVKGFWARTLGAYFNKRYARKLVDQVVSVHGYEILKMGVFNGDPHPVRPPSLFLLS